MHVTMTSQNNSHEEHFGCGMPKSILLHFYGTCPSIIFTHSTPDVTHKLGQVQAKMLFPNPTPICSLLLMARANKQGHQCDKIQLVNPSD